MREDHDWVYSRTGGGMVFIGGAAGEGQFEVRTRTIIFCGLSAQVFNRAQFNEHGCCDQATMFHPDLPAGVRVAGRLKYIIREVSLRRNLIVVPRSAPSHGCQGLPLLLPQGSLLAACQQPAGSSPDGNPCLGTLLWQAGGAEALFENK